MIALVIVIAFTFIGAFVILKITDLLLPLRVSVEEKKVGQDFSQHGENLFPTEYPKEQLV
jgi:Amt family ammonium transporter